MSVGLRITDLAFEINTTIKKEQAMPTKTDPTIIETAAMRIWVDYRRGIDGDEGLTFDVTAAGEKDGARILRFDCFSKTPHYHVGSSPKSPVHDMNALGHHRPGALDSRAAQDSPALDGCRSRLRRSGQDN